VTSNWKLGVINAHAWVRVSERNRIKFQQKDKTNKNQPTQVIGDIIPDLNRIKQASQGGQVGAVQLLLHSLITVYVVNKWIRSRIDETIRSFTVASLIPPTQADSRFTRKCTYYIQSLNESCIYTCIYNVLLLIVNDQLHKTYSLCRQGLPYGGFNQGGNLSGSLCPGKAVVPSFLTGGFLRVCPTSVIVSVCHRVCCHHFEYRRFGLTLLWLNSVSIVLWQLLTVTVCPLSTWYYRAWWHQTECTLHCAIIMEHSGAQKVLEQLLYFQC
jgi:hypothetical protein